MNKMPKIKFILDKHDKNIKKFYFKNITLSIRKLGRIFLKSPNSLTLYIFQNRKAFLKAINREKAPDWVIGYVPHKNTSSIYLYYSEGRKKDLPKTLTHEIAHIYLNLYNSILPVWIKEGICIYLAQQIFKPSIKIRNWRKIAPDGVPFKNVKWTVAVKNNGYNSAGLLTLFLIRRYGWKNFLKALKLKNFTFKNLAAFFNEKEKNLANHFKKLYVTK
jgi:hypothetical protein